MVVYMNCMDGNANLLTDGGWINWIERYATIMVQ